ncbi:hypothetical protein IHQ68_06435 [Chelatococcus sambhunathii]|uniref:Uncharacterized protein n=1 Tax=Chelatococcus sambhunathii TaxID=363953 RepID=A0ABU1DDY4_9HYPH|nr:hypothetical protein [Chelatococcus sambhunathii]MDR4306253.1 hypothetical protein [Chelatococcus sambhunathii]
MSESAAAELEPAGDKAAAGVRRGLIIGNSYAIALKDGLEDSDLPCREDFSFLCAPGSELAITVADGRIVPTSERAMTFMARGLSDGDMPLDDYDIFVLAGLGVGGSQCSRVYRSWRLAAHADERHSPISRAVLRAALGGLLRQTISYRIAAQIRAHTDKPIVIVPQPNPIARIKTVEPTTDRLRENFDRWGLFFDEAVAEELYSAFLDAARGAFGEIPAAFMEQPPSTRSGFFTRDEYQMKLRTTYDRSLQVPNTTEDVTHMNADFGRPTMETLWADVGGAG